MENRSIKRGAYVILVMIFGFVIWSLFVPLDSGTPSSGIVSVDGHRKAIQHSLGGVVDIVLVKEGDKVKEGDDLIQLEDSAAKSALSQAKSELDAVNAQIAMLEKVMPGLRGLVSEGYYSRNQYLDKERKLLESRAQRAGLIDKINAADKEYERTIIKSPVDGSVMGLTVTNKGAVVVAGSKLMEIAPINDELVIDAQIRPNLIDKIYPGKPAQVRFTAMQTGVTPVVVGKLQWVSADRFQNREDKINPEGYYLARVSVGKDQLARLGSFQVVAGMPADVIIKTGERTFFQYLMKPIFDRLAYAFKEY
ncbi:HlyD family efflux transporter periplasmic adaptor subunit [Polynucleobacter sinensis]|uniref:HlyD family efflux transporter periplasmic adaptor subunit n=1 Tax=Polynucleobacter sinensis TaxID=1743157 RepID=UPI0007832431|nr:HlyD family efflux transporter periplasmic adaptor subunit [Polynucleobacter sinensis]